MMKKSLIRILALALALLLCLSLLPMAALAAEDEKGAQEETVDEAPGETPQGNEPAEEPGETPQGNEPAEEAGEGVQGEKLGGAADGTMLADGAEKPRAEITPAALTGSLAVWLRTYDGERQQYVLTAVSTAAVGDTLYAAVGEDCNNSGTLYYKWQRDGATIPGAEGQLYTVTEDDEGAAISCFAISDAETGAISSAAVRVPKPETEPDPNPAPETGVVRIYKTEDNTDTGEKLVIEPELGKEYALPACAFTRDGCTFTGYNTAADGSGTAYKVGDPYTLTEENPTLELYAQWQENAPETVTVTFDANGGTGTMEAQTMEKGKETALTANAFTFEGHSFEGWATAADGAKVYDDKQSVTLDADTTLYAVWKENAPETVTVTFDKNGGTGTMEAQTMEKGKETALTANAFTREGYSFEGWATAKDGAKVYDDKQGVKLDADTTLYAVWKETAPETVTVTFDKNGGTGTMEAQTMEKGKETALTANAFTREGYSFEGWAAAKDGAKTYDDKAKVTLDADTTLYAVWKKDADKLTGTVTLSGDPYVGESLTAMVTDTNNTGTLSYQWQRDGKDIDGATAGSYELTDADLGKKISCIVTSSVETGKLESPAVTVLSPVTITVTFTGEGKVLFDEAALKSGGKVTVPAGATAVFTFDPDAAVTSVKQDGTEVGKKAGYLFDKDGKLDVTFATVTVGGNVWLDQTLTTTVTGVPTGKNPVFQWTRGGENIEGADKASYTLTDDDAEKEIRCVVTDADKSFTAVSKSVTPAARPAAPSGVTIQQHITNDADESLGGHIGRITGLNSTMQVSVNADGPWLNVPDNSAAFTTKFPRTYYVRSRATSTAPASQALALEVKDFVTTVKPLSSTQKDIYKYDITLSEKDQDGKLSAPSIDPGEAVAFLIPYPAGLSKDSHNLKLVHDTDGKSVAFTQEDNGILGKSESFSPFTLTAEGIHDLTGTVKIDGYPAVGETLTASLTDTNNTGVLTYQWTRDGVNIEGATATKYAPTESDLGRKIACVVTSSVQPGSVKSDDLTVLTAEIKVTQLLINDGNPEIEISQPARIVGVTTDMEYSINGVVWTQVPAVPFEVTQPGTYRFRDKDTQAQLGEAKVTAYYTLWVNVRGTEGSVTARATGGGLLDYDTNCWLVELGETVTLTFTPEKTTHTVTYLTVDGKSVTKSKTLQLKNVQNPHVVAVTFGASNSSPRTGDSSNLGLWSALGVTSLAALAALAVLQKKRRFGA